MVLAGGGGGGDGRGSGWVVRTEDAAAATSESGGWLQLTAGAHYVWAADNSRMAGGAALAAKREESRRIEDVDFRLTLLQKPSAKYVYCNEVHCTI